ncbi:Acg family FMN-binding oxidoreductase [Streptomyces sp. XH2]|uniref:Acg family FMN-binding oxidoreductase n=1 Tax=Streptomyces sp. XH2 TaxID=3412483 RepID=UPI003C7A5826
MSAPEVGAHALETLVAAAAAAPSMHNSQPWRFRTDPASRTIGIRTVAGRATPLSDPRRRAQHLAIGAAVFNLRVAAAEAGWEPVVELLPDPCDPGLLATVALHPGPADRSRHPRLYDAIAQRRSSRLPFTGRPVPEAIVAEMASGARAEGAGLYLPDIVGTRRLLAVTAEAERRNHLDEARTRESRSWIVPPGTGPYGIPVTALGPRDARERMPLRDFTGASRTRPVPALPFERHAQLALVCTGHDRPADWLRAGQALERVLLLATAHGVRTSALYQALEWPDLRGALLRGRPGHAQFLIRFGYGPQGPPTPRAAVAEVTWK